MRGISKQGKCKYEMQRIVSWEHNALALNVFHEHVWCSSHCLLVYITRSGNFAGMPLFIRAGHIYT